MSSKGAKLRKTFKSIKVLDNADIKTGSVSSVSVARMPASLTIPTGSATLTAPQVLNGVLTQTPAANSTLTLPTATVLIAAVPGVQVGDCIQFSVINLAAVTYNTVLAADGSSGTLVGNGTILPVSTRSVIVRFDNIVSPAYTMYMV